MKKFLRSRFQVFLVLVLAGLAVYANAIPHPFVHDDVVFIQQNPNINRWDNIAAVFLMPSAMSTGVAIQVPYYRPLLEVMYRLEFLLFGMNPAGFHAFNVSLHIVNAFFVFLLGAFLRLPRSWAFFMALVFLVHPIQSEAVACISGISNLILAFFCLATILSYFQARLSDAKGKLRWSVLTAASFSLALFSKEQAVAVPGIILAYEFLWRRGSFRPFSRWALLAGLCWITAAYLFWRQVMFPGMVSGAFENPGELVLRLASIPRTILDYLAVIFWPADLHYYRSVDILLPKLATALWFVSVFFLTIALCLVLLGRLGRWAWFGVIWFIVALLPVLNIVPLINEYSLILTAEHFLYLPLVGFLIFFAAALGWTLRTLRGELSPGMCRVLLALILGVLSIITVRQNSFWKGEVPLFERTLRFESGFGRVHLLLGRAYAGENRFPEALAEYARGLRIMEDYVTKAGSSQARNVYRDYLQSAHFECGECYRNMGQLERANEEYALSLGMDVSHQQGVSERESRVANHWALNLIRMGEKAKGKGLLHRALTLNARNVEAMNNLGMLSLEAGQPKTAVFWFERAIKVDPLFRAPWDNLKRIQKY